MSVLRSTVLVLVLSSCAATVPARSGRIGSAKQSGDEPVPARLACSVPSDCVLRERDPCSCGTTTASDVEAIAGSWSRAHPPTGTESCPDCLHESSPDLFATCRSGRCAVLDVSASAYTRCSADSDCMAIDVGCCPPCGPHWHFVPVRSSRSDRLHRELCGADWATVTCPACASPPPPAHTVTCDAGTCRLTPG